MCRDAFSMSRLISICFIAILAASSFAGRALPGSYGYALDKDPLLLGMKKLFSALKKKDLSRVKKVLDGLDWQVKELASPKDVHVAIGPRLQKALKSGKQQLVLREVLDLVHLALAQKLHWNLVEKLKKYGPARARLRSARQYYLSIFSGNIKKLDLKARTQRHKEFLKLFASLKRDLGSPGLFGSGRRPPDVKDFKLKAGKILKLLEGVFPQLTRVQL